MEKRLERVYGKPVLLSPTESVEGLLIKVRNHLVASEENQQVLDMVEATLLVIESQYLKDHPFNSHFQFQDWECTSRGVAQDALARSPFMTSYQMSYDTAQKQVAMFGYADPGTRYCFSGQGHALRRSEVGEARYNQEIFAAYRVNCRVLTSKSSPFRLALNALTSFCHNQPHIHFYLICRMERVLIGRVIQRKFC